MANELEDRLRLPAPRSEVVAGGHLDKTPGGGEVDRDLRAYALVYLIEGGGYYRDGSTPERRVAAGDALLLFPGKRHCYYNGDQPTWSEIWLVFRGGAFEQLERDGLLDRDRPVAHPGLDQGLIDAFDTIISSLSSGDWRQAPGLVARTHLLCAEIMRLDQAHRPDADLAQRACARLSEALDRPLDLARVARELGMGYEGFRKAFARAVGMPPARWRQLKRIERARQLLVSGDLPLARVAEQLGYCDQYFFNRQFTHVTGMSPARFRREFASSRTRR